MKRYFKVLFWGSLVSVSAGAQSVSEGEAVLMSPLTVLSPRVANQLPAATFATPVSALRYEPTVDVQLRNFTEGQADIAIRGGTFANSSFGLAGLPLYDPQTGHYTSEIPVAPGMMTAPQVTVGADLAAGGGVECHGGRGELRLAAGPGRRRVERGGRRMEYPPSGFVDGGAAQ